MSKKRKKQRISSLTQQKNTLEGELEQLRSDISKAKDELEGLKEKINKTKDEREEYIKEINEVKENRGKNAKLVEENNRLESENTRLESENTRLESQGEDLSEQVTSLEDRRDELVMSIRLQAGIVGSGAEEPFAFPLEVVEKRSCAEACACAVADGDEMLRKHDLCSYINKIISVRGVLRVSDIRTGIRLARALGNTVYELCQPSPKWFEFKDFWREALRGIWESAHAKPDVWHVLLIENVDIASPECWGAPLWNLFDGKTTKLPCSDKSNLPKNLRVVVSLAPENLGIRTEFAKRLGEKIGVEGPTMGKEEFLESLENISKLNERLFFTTKG